MEALIVVVAPFLAVIAIFVILPLVFPFYVKYVDWARRKFGQ